MPDGMTIDAEGNLWVALWGGACVGKFNPLTGELLQKVKVPAPNVSSSGWTATLHPDPAVCAGTMPEYATNGLFA